MLIEDFKLERYFAKYEFKAKYLLSSSDCDGYSLDYILSLATPDEQKLWKNLRFGYTESSGSDFLKEEIRKHYSTISADKINVMSPGEANFILMNILVYSGDEVICQRPSYQSLYQVAVSLKANLKFWNCRADTKFYIQDLEEIISSKTKLLILNFPHNPTGFVPTNTELMQIIELASKYNIFIFSDEMYRMLIHDEKDEIPSVCDIYENSACLWGMSKSFGLAGLRIGWVCTHRKDLLDKIASFKDYLSICNNAAGEVLSFIALRHWRDFIIPNKNKINRNKEIFKGLVSKYDNFFEYYEAKGGSTVLVRQNTGMSSYELAEKIVNEIGIMLVPSEMFDYGDNHLRIGLGRENFPEALKIFDEYLSEKFL